MTCDDCGRPAAWQCDGRPLCSPHAADAALMGRSVVLVPGPGLVARLEAVEGVEVCRDAAAEIRRLRARVAELEAGQSAEAEPLASGLRLGGGFGSLTEG
jgi:hypothetical protein